ncbi:TetR/AcrR family transcriptional regulator [Colwellia sp. RSH04]|uniref:TetR/AcrR family transcriptional regulator n=1 Tax=Colwellia sp. RSH04 TaxID=2305464 RepID=UPI000E584C5B|nr:TetR/AcrR family transcriptional regulator [Colwellia sp. RSH04]RHW76317.1 TetR/AcrR family transcriptional regulator [Colwellia sp. RSH04]
MAPAPKYSPDEQEKLILNAAIAVIEQTNLLDFSMSAIAKLAGLSMGSVYKFVQCKEDVLIALATNMYQQRHLTYQQVLSLPLNTPQRIIAMSLLSYSKVQMYSFDDQLESIVNTTAMMKRCSTRWVQHMVNCGEVCESTFKSFIKQAADSGELITVNHDIDEIGISTWSMMIGYFQVVRIHENWQMNQIPHDSQHNSALAPEHIHIRNMQRLLNTFDWREKLTSKSIVDTCKSLEQAGLR